MHYRHSKTTEGEQPLSDYEKALGALLADEEKFAHPDRIDLDLRQIQTDLHDRFSTCLASHAPWQESCTCLISHPLFVYQLHICTNETSPKQENCYQMYLDVKLNFILMFLQKYERNPGLGYNPDLGKDHISGWMRTVMRDILPQAWRQARRLASEFRSLPAQLVESEGSGSVTEDVYLIINNMKDRDRKLAFLIVEGYKPREIAAEMELPMSWVYRNGPRMRKRLARLLKDIRPKE
jgi:hypothetical protein